MGSELEASEPLRPDDTSDGIEDTEKALDQAIKELRGTLDKGKQPGAVGGVGESGAEAGADADFSRVNRNLVMSIPVSVQVVLGSVEIPLSELMALKQGSTIGLDRRLGEPIDIVANGQRIAQGEITVIEGEPARFGVKLTSVIEN